MKSLEKAAMTLVCLMTLAASSCPPARAATVYRCGNAYSGVPCPGAAVIAPDDPRSEEQVAAARDVASREKALGARMEADRRYAGDRPGMPAQSTVVKRVRAKTLAVPPQTPVGWAGRRGRLLQDNGQGDFVAFLPRVSQGKSKK